MRAVLAACICLASACSADEEPARATGGSAGSGASSGTGGGGFPDASSSGGGGGTDAGGGGGASGAVGGAAGAAGAGGVPGGKARYSAVLANFDTQGTTWARHVNYSFESSGSVAATEWEWVSNELKGKTAYTEHRCTFEGVTKDCFVFTPTGWVEPAKQYQNRSGSYQVAGSTLNVTWSDGASETWSIESTSSPKLARISLSSSSFGATHGAGYGSNASWQTFRTLPEIIAAGGLKKWSGQRAMASSNGSVVTVSDWASSIMNLSEFTSASWASAGTTLHAMLPHSPSVCVGACSGPHTGKIMYHLASTNTGRQMAYNNWCTCLSQAAEWPCYDRNMHPLALNSIIDDDGTHRGWLFVEQQNQPGYAGYQYQIGWFSDL